MTFKQPLDWRKVKFGEVIQFNPRESLKKGTITKKISMSELKPFQRKIDNFETTEYSGGVKFRNGDTLLARITPSLENGKTAQVDVLGKGEIGFGSTEYIVLREKEKLIINDYIYYLSISSFVREVAIKSMTGTSGRQRVQTDVIKEQTFLIPPIKEQRLIAETLSVLDNKIEINNKINKNLEQKAQAIFKHWFVDFEFPNEEGMPYKSSGGEMIETELGFIPEDWQVAKFSDVFEFVKGKVPTYLDYNHELAEPYLNKAALDGKWNEIKYGKKSTGIRCNELDILMMMDGSSSSEVFYGYRGLVGSTLSLIKTAEDDVRELLFLYFSIYNDQLKNQNTGSAIPHANKHYINNLKMALPKSKIFRKKYTSFFKQVRKINLNNQHENEKLSELRNTLLPKLMSGEIRIPLD